MAADPQPKAINGDYGVHQSYGQADPVQISQSSGGPTGNAPPSAYGDETPIATAAASSESATVTESSKPPSKDEVGWYFVESYYTTLSKSPETLYVSNNLMIPEMNASIPEPSAKKIHSYTTISVPNSFQALRLKKSRSLLASAYVSDIPCLYQSY